LNVKLCPAVCVGHLGWRADLSDTIIKGDQPSTIVIEFGCNWLISFREEDC